MNGNKIIKAVTALVFVGVAAVLVFLTIHEIGNGIETMRQKGILALYGVLFIYAVVRIFTLVKDIFSK
jgi:hypothetical protein